MGAIAEAVARGVALVDGRKAYGDFFSLDDNNRLCACWYGAFYLGCEAITVSDLLADKLAFDSEDALEYACYDAFPDYSLFDAFSEVQPDLLSDNGVDWDEITRKVEEAYYG